MKGEKKDVNISQRLNLFDSLKTNIYPFLPAVHIKRTIAASEIKTTVCHPESRIEVPFFVNISLVCLCASVCPRMCVYVCVCARVCLCFCVCERARKCVCVCVGECTQALES